MTTKQLHAVTGVPCKTIRRLARELDGVPIGGCHGYEFPKDAPKWLRALLREKRGGAQWRKPKTKKPPESGNSTGASEYQSEIKI